MTVFATRLALYAMPGKRQLCALALGGLLTVAAPATVWAQLGGMGGMPSSGRGSPIQSKAAPEKPALPAPDAVPGAKARTPAAPPTHVANDMPPTEALFDAINRGDMAGARDALNRGADLNGVNVLGMTPMELSVDLGRNDISFMLLSMRGEDSGRGSRAVARDIANPAPAAKPPSLARSAAQKKSAARSKPTDIPVATKPIATPKLFANDGGTPVPSAGFLGFDGRSATN